MARQEIKPTWNSSSFLTYAGGLTVLYSGLAALIYLATQFHGHGAQTAWALFIFVVLYAIAYALRRAERTIAAGIFAYAAVSAWIWVVIFAVVIWWGWVKTSPLTHWSWGAIAALLVIWLVAWDARRRFAFPFIRAISAMYFFALVLFVLPGGGNWTAVWALLVGLLYLMIGRISDKPSTFWLHLYAGALIGGAFLYWFHKSTGDYAVISILSLLFVLVGYSTSRSSWTVYGTIGFFIATTYYVGSSYSPTTLLLGAAQQCSGSGSGLGGIGQTCTPVGSSFGAWSPAVAFALLGFWLVLLGMVGKRKKGHTPAHTHPAVVVEQTTVVVETPAPPAPPAPPAE